MIFLLREMFKRRGWDGYKAVHHYADIGMTAGAGAAIALAIGTDTASARYYFENTIFFAGAASLMMSFRTATTSEPDSKLPRVMPYMTKWAGGAVLGVAIATAPVLTLPGTEGMSIKDRIMQDNKDYVPLRKRQKAAEKAAAATPETEGRNVSHETMERPAILVVPQKRGLGL